MSKSLLTLVSSFILALVLVTICDTRVFATPAEDALKQGRDFFFNEDYKRALVALDKAVKLNPTSAEAYAYLADTKYRSGSGSSLDDANKAISLDPNYEYGYSCRGDAFEQMGQHQKAIDNYTKAIQLNPEYDYVFYQRGMAYSELGQYQKAIDDLSKNIALRPSDALAYLSRAYSYAKSGQHQKAAHDFGKAVSLQPRLLGRLVDWGHLGIVIALITVPLVALTCLAICKIRSLFPQTLKAVKQSKGQVILLIGIYLVTSIVPSATILNVAAVYPWLILMSRVIRNSLQDQGWQDSTYESLAPIFFIGLIYNLVDSVLLCLFVVPGIWWASRSCLAVVISVATGERNSFRCLELSGTLTKNHLLEVVKYMWPPVALLLILLVIGSVGEIAGKILDNATIQIVSRFLVSTGAVLVQLSAFPMLVHLYLSFSKDTQVSPT